jgi:MFS superfamily sulfate permease-like transporter
MAVLAVTFFLTVFVDLTMAIGIGTVLGLGFAKWRQGKEKDLGL